MAECYLRRLREAAMLERRNIARQETLLTLARRQPDEFKRFHDDLMAPQTAEAFRQDLRDAACYGIGRFPALILHRADGRGRILVGYRPYDALSAALEHVAPDLRRRSELSPEDLVVAYVTYWRRVISRELAEVAGGDSDQISQLLASLVSKGTLMQAKDSPGETPIYVPIPQREESNPR